MIGCFTKRTPQLLAGLSWVLLLPRAGAAGSPEQADALFRQGLEEMRAGHYQAGCTMLDRSYQLDPLPGALFTLAECDAAWGKSATAIERYQVFLNELTTLPPERRDSFDERRTVALAKVTALSATVPMLDVDVAPGAPQSLVVRCNGELLSARSYGVSKKVDPGEYVISAELEDGTVWRHRVALAERERAHVLVPWPFAAAAPAQPKSVAPAPAATSRAQPASPAPIAAYVAAGVGATGLLVGSIAGGIALSKKSTITDNCQGRLCNAKGREAADSAKSAAALSTVGFVTAGVGAATAIVLLLTGKAEDAPRRASFPSPSIAFDGARGVSLVLEGRLQ